MSDLIVIFYICFLKTPLIWKNDEIKVGIRLYSIFFNICLMKSLCGTLAKVHLEDYYTKKFPVPF